MPCRSGLVYHPHSRRIAMDDEFALFAAEISKLDEEAPPSTSGAAAGSGDAPPKIEAPPPPAPTVNSRPKVIAKAPEHVPAGPAARPPEAASVSAGPTAPHGYHETPGVAATGTHLQRGWAGVEAVHLPSAYPPPPPGVNGVAHGDLGSIPPPPPQPVKKIGKPVFRSAGGDRWEDKSLADWPENDYRIFVGDLGAECTDETLARAFARYPSFQKARVVKDRHSGKGKGFGFVSLMDGGDYARAIKEMNGKYIGNRPCKLRKSDWTTRNDTRAGPKVAPKRKPLDKRRHIPIGPSIKR